MSEITGTQRSYRLMGVQMACRDSVAANAEAIATYLELAGSKGVDFCVFPEMCLTGYHDRFDQYEAKQGYERVSATCAKARVCALVGSGEKRGRDCFNQVRVYSDTGNLLGVHEKILLTDGDMVSFKCGSTFRTFQHKGLTFGCLICNDFWCNPAGTSLLDLKLPYQLAKLGAEVIFHSVASGTEPLWYDFHVGNLKARAATAGVYVATANQAYDEGPVNCPSGVVSRTGEWLVQAPREGEGWYLTDLEL